MKKVLEVKDIQLVEDLSEGNVIKDEQGNITGYRRSEFVCHTTFKEKGNDNGVEYLWVSHFPHLAENLRLIANNEDYKYPNGLGRNMVFNSYLYPIWKNYLIQNNFIPPQRDIDFSIQQAKKLDPNVELFLKEVEDANANKN